MRLQLEQIRVQSPCSKSWHDLAGDSGKRFCDECGLHVHNLSALSRADAESLVDASAGQLCVAYAPTEGGTPRTLDYRLTPPKSRWQRRWIFGSSIAAMLVAAFEALAWARKPPPVLMVAGGLRPPPVTMAMGKPAPQSSIAAQMTVGEIAPSLPTTQPAPATQPMEPTILGDISPPTTQPCAAK